MAHQIVTNVKKKLLQALAERRVCFFVFYLLAEVSNATDLEGARRLRILHLQVHSGPHAFGHADALQQWRVQVEMLRHGAADFTKVVKKHI